MTRRVTLLSDFGTADGYVAAMKGVLATRAPDAHVDDVAHDLPAGDVDAASRALARYWSLYPEGTVHVVVVDPGVGTTRRGLALSVRGRFIVAPDNGIVTDVLAVDAEATTPAWRAVELVGIDPPGSPSRTFHGRDLFAPAAALLATGEALAGLGPSVSDPVRLPRTVARRDAGRVGRGTVTGVDRFGNLSTDLPGAWLDEAASVEIAGRRIRPGGTYADVAEGALVALVGSDGHVEIAARNEAAARALGVGPGAAVILRPEGEG